MWWNEVHQVQCLPCILEQLTRANFGCWGTALNASHLPQILPVEAQVGRQCHLSWGVQTTLGKQSVTVKVGLDKVKLGCSVSKCFAQGLLHIYCMPLVVLHLSLIHVTPIVVWYGMAADVFNHVCGIQWNLWNKDTAGPCKSVLILEVSLIRRFPYVHIL